MTACKNHGDDCLTSIYLTTLDSQLFMFYPVYPHLEKMPVLLEITAQLLYIFVSGLWLLQ